MCLHYIDDTMYCSLLSIEDIESAIRDLKRGKASGVHTT